MMNIISYVLFGMSMVLLVGNLYLLGMSLRSEGRISRIPYLGGLLCFAALWLHPDYSVMTYFWVPLVLDVTIPVQLIGIFYYLLGAGKERTADAGPKSESKQIEE